MIEHLALAQSLITAEQQRFLQAENLTLEDFLRGGMRGVWQDREHAYQTIFHDWNRRLGQRTFTRTWDMLRPEEKEKLLIAHVLHWPILHSSEEEIESYPAACYSSYYQHLCWLVCREEHEEAEQFRPLYHLSDAQEVLDLFDQAVITIDHNNKGDTATRYSTILFRGDKQAMAQARLLSEAAVLAALRFEQVVSDTGIVLVD
jgi:hypothetical protein